MRKKIFMKMSVLLMILALSAQVSLAKDDVRGSRSLNKTSGTPSVSRLNINQITTILNCNGISDQNGSNPGYYYPTLSGKTANFVSGLVFGAYVGPVSDNVQKVTGSLYRTSMTPGRIISPGNPDNSANANVRIYRVRRDYKTGSVSVEALDESKTEDAVRAQYEKDWNEWPVAWGAPFEDIGKLGSDGKPVVDAQGNNVKDGIYDPLIDIPGVPGADQTIWFVANDLNKTQASTFYGSTPMGVEMQCTAWAYRQAGALGNMIFKKYVIINKNQDKKDFNDAFVAYASDTDIGGGSLDYSGCDTTLSLFYTFSSDNKNQQYGANPPATGFDFFQGPKYKTGNMKDTAIFNGKYLPGWKNLGMTSHFYFINSDATMSDPDQASSVGISQWYNLFDGKVGVTGAPYIDPNTKKATKFPLAGDPVAKTGWLDGVAFAAGDRRNGGASGPFNIAYGDTQEVVVAQISAGASAGVDNLGAVSLLKQYDKTAQIAYNRLFKLPQPAPAPKLTTSSFDQKIILNWGADNSAANATENYSVFGYTFQGYNVYQLPTASSTVTEGKLIKTYDKIDGITSILDKTTDAASGALVDFVAAKGSDNGIKRTLEITKDDLTGSELHNGSKYYFAVTSYSYNPNPPFGAKVLENPLSIVTVIPNQPAPGVSYTSKGGDPVTVTRASGTSDGTVSVSVIDPSKVTGDAYKVSFVTSGTNVFWQLNRSKKNKVTGAVKDTVILANQTQSQASAPLVVDGVEGLQLQVSGPAPAIKSNSSNAAAGIVETAYNGKLLTSAQYDAAGTAFKGNALWHNLNSAQTERYFVSAGGGSGTLDRLTRSISNAVPYDFSLIFTDTTATDNDWGVWGFDNGKIGKVPFQLWRHDPVKKDSVRLIPILYTGDAGNEGHFGVKYEETWGGYPATDWIYWYYDSHGYDAFAKACADGDETAANNFGEVEYFSRMIFGDYDGNGKIAPKGTVVRIITTKPNTTTDAFAFTAPSVNYSADQAKLDVEKINVYPNPYYGVNPQELTKYSRWVTFTHLPPKATIRIFNLAGQLVKTIVKDNNDQEQRWDLLNDSLFPVGNGLFIAHIDMPDLGKTKILKVAIIQEKQILDRF